jgi:hypothetical protein
MYAPAGLAIPMVLKRVPKWRKPKISDVIAGMRDHCAP